ncbi:adenosylcobinamide-phosphate synthase CbiB [Albidovulum sp.]|uniref:adenosylcobinamide-phosphate synthase CbiB n=1 Tax=Albidovulum sp. TaxID=1872424 RepID=UPI0039B92AF1
MTGAMMMLVALGLDSLLGWPNPVFRVIGHPVSWLGRLVGALDRWINLDGADDGARRIAGVVAAAVVIGAAAEIAWVLTWLVPGAWPGVVLTGVLAWPFVAVRSLRDHVQAVALPLADGDLAAARRAVSMIVGRDPEQLGREGVARAALESLAENTSDAVVAPIFWGVIFGLPGIAAYKAINTLDSMIGHRTPRHHAFGWASARIDDLANLIPARLTGLLFALVSTRPRAALATMWRDARRHRSPNAGWPEAALAGALEIRLSGPRVYHDHVADEPWLNEGAADPQAADIARALRLFRFVVLALALILAVLSVV